MTVTFVTKFLDSAGDPVSSAISMTFSGAAFTQASFDWEIFPDNTCKALDDKHCGGAGNPNKPDLEFEAGANTVATLYGVTPGTGATYSNSPRGAETAPQAIGTGSWTFASSSTFQFVDRPATIGIDNLTLSTSLTFNSFSGVPEPTSIALLITTLLGCYLIRKKRQQAIKD